MSETNGPRHNRAHPDYRLECEFQLEPAFMEIVAAAEKAGWEPVTVARAMKSLAANYMLMREANMETDIAIEVELRKRGL